MLAAILAAAVCAQTQAPPFHVRDAIAAAQQDLKRGGAARAETAHSLASILQEIPAADPSRAPLLSVLSMVHASRGEMAEAGPLMIEALELAPSEPGVAGMMLKLSEEEAKLGRTDEARRLLHALLDVHPSGTLAADAHYQLGALLGGTAPEAREAYRTSIRLAEAASAPKPQALIALSLSLSSALTAADPLTSATEYESRLEAIDLARRALQIDGGAAPVTAQGHLALGKALAASGDAASGGAGDGEGWASERLSDDERREAIDALRTAQSLGGLEGGAATASVLHMIGGLLASAPDPTDSQLREALSSFERAMALAPEDAQHAASHEALRAAIQARGQHRAEAESEEAMAQQAEEDAHMGSSDQQKLQLLCPLEHADAHLQAAIVASAVKEDPTAAEAALQSEGTVSLEGLLPAAEAARLLEHIDSEMEVALALVDRGEAARSSLFSPIASRHRRSDFKLRIDDVVTRALSAPLASLGPLLERVLGTDPLLLELAAIAVDDGAPPQPLHAKHKPTAWGGGVPSLSAYLALHDIGEEAIGPTVFLPGTHTQEAHAAFYGRDGEGGARADGAQGAPSTTPAPLGRDELFRSSRRRLGLMPAGSATLFDQRLLHAGGPNSAGRRGVLLCISFGRRELAGAGPSGSLRSEYVGAYGLRNLTNSTERRPAPEKPSPHAYATLFQFSRDEL